MNRALNFIFPALVAAIILSFGLSRLGAQSQEKKPVQPSAQTPADTNAQKAQSDTQNSADSEAKKDDDEDDNPFAPEPAPTLPPGMKGSDTNDPRAKLSPGLYNAGESALGMKHVV